MTSKQNTRFLIKTSTINDRNPPSGYILKELAARTISISECQTMENLLLKRLQKNKPYIKYKVLRIIKFLSENGSTNWRHSWQKHTDKLREAQQLYGPPDPIYGDANYRQVREAANDAMHAIFATSNQYDIYDQDIECCTENIILHKHEISANIKDRYANITYYFEFENVNKNGSDELKFDITIDSNAFISKFEANIDGQIFIGKTKEKETASKEYNEAKEKNENAILISQPHQHIQNVFQIKTNIDAKSKILLTIQIQQYLSKKFGFNELNIEILRNFNKYNISPMFDGISFKFNVEDKSGIYNVDIPIIKSDNDVIIDKKTMDKLHKKCEINGKIMMRSSVNELLLKYKIKGEEDESHILFDNKTNTFCHVISDIITDSIINDTNHIDEGHKDKIKSDILIPRRVMFVIDRSGSMSGSKWTKTISATIAALKQLKKGYDRFGIILFDDNIELLPYGNMTGCILADNKSISVAIKSLQNSSSGGCTNINDALLKSIDLIKTDIKSLNNDNKYKYNFFMNQIIFITDGEPNVGEQDTNKIVLNVKNANNLNNKMSIFSFGVGRDGNDWEWINDLNHSFLKILSLNNNGIYQRIKQTSAHTVLNQYFCILSKPVLTNINIKYNNKNITDLTETHFNTLYAGNDLIICGKIKSKHKMNDYILSLTISAITGKAMKENNKLITKPIHISKEMKIYIDSNDVDHDINNSEEIWAYLKLQQFAKQKLIHNDMIEMDDDEKTANNSLPLSLALKYKFVTPWTSMIVVKKKKNGVGTDNDNYSPQIENRSYNTPRIKNRMRPRFGGAIQSMSGFGGTSYKPKVSRSYGCDDLLCLDLSSSPIRNSCSIRGTRKKGKIGGVWGDHTKDEEEEEEEEEDMFANMRVKDDDMDDNQMNDDILVDILSSLTSNDNNNNNDNNDLLFGANTGFAALKGELSGDLMKSPRSHETDKILFKNKDIQISYFKIFKPNESIICIFISNLTGNDLSSISISIKKQDPFQFGFDGTKCIPFQFTFDVSRDITSLIIPKLTAYNTIYQMITFGANPTQISMPCNIVISINEHILQIGIKMSDLLRASKISTKQFGINWSKLSNESYLFNINVSNASMTDYIERVTEQLHLHYIETIKNESIVAGNLLSVTNCNVLFSANKCNVLTPILIHCKCLESKSYSIIIRTSDWNISKLIGDEIEQLLLSSYN